MKMTQTLLVNIALFSAFTGVVLPAANAEVTASVGAASMYYWRGYDLGGGAALFGDVKISKNGFAAGVWTSSGDEILGTEYDLYVGYSGSVDSFSYGINIVSYNYANPKGEDGDGATWEPVKPGDYVEVVPFIGFGIFKLTYYDAINADHPYFSKDYRYITAELNFKKFDLKYGLHDDAPGLLNDGVAHLDATYKYNDKLSFTVGKIIDDNDGAAPDEANVLVSYSFPLQ